jgi:hypothetical protein
MASRDTAGKDATLRSRLIVLSVPRSVRARSHHAAAQAIRLSQDGLRGRTAIPRYGNLCARRDFVRSHTRGPCGQLGRPNCSAAPGLMRAQRGRLGRAVGEGTATTSTARRATSLAAVDEVDVPGALTPGEAGLQAQTGFPQLVGRNDVGEVEPHVVQLTRVNGHRDSVR